MTHVYIILYLAIGLAIYFTLPNRKSIPINLSLPFIVAWFILALVFLVYHPKKPKQ